VGLSHTGQQTARSVCARNVTCRAAWPRHAGHEVRPPESWQPLCGGVAECSVWSCCPTCSLCIIGSSCLSAYVSQMVLQACSTIHASASPSTTIHQTDRHTQRILSSKMCWPSAATQRRCAALCAHSCHACITHMQVAFFTSQGTVLFRKGSVYPAHATASAVAMPIHHVTVAKQTAHGHTYCMLLMGGCHTSPG
jgi:hypothetical protein